MTERRLSRDEVAAVRHGVKAAFRELGKSGFIVRTNFSCCTTCAVAELSEISEKRRRNRAVYWHRQDEEHFRKGHALHIRFCYLPGNIQGDTAAAETRVGEQVAVALRNQRLQIEWDGNPGKTIQVIGVLEPPNQERTE